MNNLPDKVTISIQRAVWNKSKMDFETELETEEVAAKIVGPLAVHLDYTAGSQEPLLYRISHVASGMNLLVRLPWMKALKIVTSLSKVPEFANPKIGTLQHKTIPAVFRTLRQATEDACEAAGLNMEDHRQ